MRAIPFFFALVASNVMAGSVSAYADEPDRHIYSFLNSNFVPIQLDLERKFDRLYTTDLSEGNASGYGFQETVGRCFSHQVAGTKPMFRLHHGGDAPDHLYTMSANEKKSAMKDNYTDEGILCYMYPKQTAGTCPMYRMMATYAGSTRLNHFYTANSTEINPAETGHGQPPVFYHSEGTAGFLISEYSFCQ
jgi:hypothetical protein